MSFDGSDDGADFFAGQDLAVCPSCGERNLARAKFCMECGARIKVESGERRTVTVVFADLSGFTSYSEMVDPEEVRALADQAARGLGQLVERFGGTVDKFIGDCVMAIFGAPVTHEDDPERAVRCALAMQTYVTENAEDFAGMKLSVGVYTGEAIYAPVGPSGTYTVLGDTVNTAARLQGAASKGEVLIGEATYRASADAIEAEEIPPIVAKNKRNPVAAWRATGVKGERAPRVVRRLPLIGRSLELSRMLERWEVARTERRPQLVAVTGAPGIGKSRLVEAFLERAAEAASIHRGRCLSYGEGITYWPIVEMIRDASGIRRDDPTDVVSKKLGTLLESLGSEDVDELRTMAVAVANIMDAPATPRGTYTAERISKAELHWGLRRIFELLALRRPVVLLIEDIHGAEPTLLELIDFFLRSNEHAPMMLVGAGRPELREEHPAFVSQAGNRRAIDLEPLSEEDGAALLAELAGPEARDALEPLLRGAGGNPLFLEEMVRMLTDAGALDDRGRPLAGDLGEIPVPQNLHALIGSRLDRLRERDRVVAGNAAVVGTVFWGGAVHHVAGDGADVATALDSLEEREIIQPVPTSTVADETEYAFWHGMLREVAYDRIPKALRAQLHERCGDWISSVTGDVDETIEFIAYHYEQACRLAMQVGRSASPPPVLAAVKALKRAGIKAMNREGLREADRFFARALELLGDGFPETAAELTFYRANTLWSLGRIDEATDAFTSVTRITETVGRPDLRGRALLALANTTLVRGRAAEARAFLRQAEQILEESDDAELRVSTGVLRGQIRAGQDADPTGAAEELTAAMQVADAQGLPALAQSARLRLGTIMLNSGELTVADHTLAEAVSLAMAQGSVRDQAIANTFLAFTRFYRGPRLEAEQLASQATVWLDRLTGHAYYMTQARQLIGLLAVADGDLARAEEALRAAQEVAAPIGGRLAVEAGRHLVEVLCRQGWVKETRQASDELRERAPEQDHTCRALVTLAAAFAATAEGDVVEARRSFTDGLLILEELRMALELAHSRIGCAWAYRRLGLMDETREQLERARVAAGSMGADALLADIDREERALP